MSTPDDRVYSETHEWHKLEDGVVTVGLTTHAVDQLTDITFVEMREPGTHVAPGDPLGEVESVKTTSDVYSAVEGEISEVNTELGDNPGLINEDPYTKGWLVKIRVDDDSGLSSCVSASDYDSDIA
ncbi:MAG: glycine cleavage system protein H [Phycisphaeraceae bacterium]|nr:MAG: glycine cleavage system protein H [Phycisphaeraceae bacterium]